jgi:uncharacterized hydrophobic protein (TIGR00271 family)
LRRFNIWLTRIARSVDHGRIREQIAAEGEFSGHYAFMTAMAAGIAIIGLLLNSPAVIIGAMLISPLMGPIVATGFSLAMLDVDMGRRGFGALMAGAAMAIAMTLAIVLVSPVQDATPEILARTRPNLFDLVVAVLSGAAGGYATVRGRGGTVVGVAIATALMPPLAVVGYGLATSQWSIARGAALLFVTNMVAISASAAVVAEWYGFGRGGIRKAFARQALVALALLALLSIPLLLSLRDIAQESYAQAVIRRTIEAQVAGLDGGQLAQLQVRFDEDEAIHADAMVVTDAPRPGFREEARAAVEKALGRPVTLRLSQVRAEDSPARARGQFRPAPRRAGGAGARAAAGSRPGAEDTLRHADPLAFGGIGRGREVGHDPRRRARGTRPGGISGDGDRTRRPPPRLESAVGAAADSLARDPFRIRLACSFSERRGSAGDGRMGAFALGTEERGGRRLCQQRQVGNPVSGRPAR